MDLSGTSGRAMPGPVRLAFLGCGFITGVHSRHLKALRNEITASYASRDSTTLDPG